MCTFPTSQIHFAPSALLNLPSPIFINLPPPISHPFTLHSSSLVLVSCVILYSTLLFLVHLSAFRTTLYFIVTITFTRLHAHDMADLTILDDYDSDEDVVLQEDGTSTLGRRLAERMLDNALDHRKNSKQLNANLRMKLGSKLTNDFHKTWYNCSGSFGRRMP